MSKRKRPLDPASLSKFNGHTPRQHRAVAAKGGKSRMKKVTREQQKEWGRLGGLRSQEKLRKLREAEEQRARALLADTGEKS